MSDLESGKLFGQTRQACAANPAPRQGAARAVFFDRDGTLIVNKPYNANPDDIEILPGTLDAMRALQAAGYLLIVITNQSGVARGYYDEAAVARMHERLNQAFAASAIEVAAYYFCPHHVDGRVPHLARTCDSRKPGPGMLRRAAADWGIDLDQSWVVGDADTDMSAGVSVGCRGILIGSTTASPTAPVVANAAEAARYILGHEARSPEHAANSSFLLDHPVG